MELPVFFDKYPTDILSFIKFNNTIRHKIISEEEFHYIYERRHGDLYIENDEIFNVIKTANAEAKKNKIILLNSNIENRVPCVNLLRWNGIKILFIDENKLSANKKNELKLLQSKFKRYVEDEVLSLIKINLLKVDYLANACVIKASNKAVYKKIDYDNLHKSLSKYDYDCYRIDEFIYIILKY